MDIIVMVYMRKFLSTCVWEMCTCLNYNIMDDRYTYIYYIIVFSLSLSSTLLQDTYIMLYHITLYNTIVWYVIYTIMF